MTQRRHSSTAAGMPAGSAARAARWSGCSARAMSPPESRWRVVSLPATSRVNEKMTSSAGVMGRPSTSAPTRAETRSSPGSAAFALACGIEEHRQLAHRRGVLVAHVGHAVGGGDGGVGPAPEVRSVGVGDTQELGDGQDGQRRDRGGRRGRWARRSGAASIRRTVSSRIRSSMGATARGVNLRFSTRRHSPWLGGSMCRMEPTMGPPVPDRVVGQHATAVDEPLRDPADLPDVVVAAERPSGRARPRGPVPQPAGGP